MFSDFFNENNPEATLYSDMIKESVEMFGIPVKYLPQHMVDTNVQNILGEDVKTYFDKAFDIKMYLQDYQNFAGAGDLFSKFGLSPDDRLTLIVEENTLLNAFQQTVGNDTQQPQPGDLLYIPLLTYFGEIIYVNKKEIRFFTFTNISAFAIVSKRLEYTGQTLETGVPEIDNLANVETQNDSDNQSIENQITEIRDFNKDNPFINIDD